MGSLAAAGRKRHGFKEGRLAYGEMTARGFVNCASLSALSSTRFSKPFVLTCCVGRWEMIVWLTNVVDPSPSAQVDVAPSTGGVDQDTQYGGSRRMREDAGGRRVALFRSEVYFAPIRSSSVATNRSMWSWRERLLSPVEPVGDSGEVVSVGINASLRPLGLL